MQESRSHQSPYLTLMHFISIYGTKIQKCYRFGGEYEIG